MPATLKSFEGLIKKKIAKPIVSAVTAPAKAVGRAAGATYSAIANSGRKRKSKANLDLAAKKYALKGTNMSEDDVARGSELIATGKVKEVKAKAKEKRKEYKKRFGL